MSEPMYDDMSSHIHVPSVEERTLDAMLRIEELLTVMVKHAASKNEVPSAEAIANTHRGEHEELEAAQNHNIDPLITTPKRKGRK